MGRTLDHTNSGDILAVWKLYHIGRSLQHFVQLVVRLRDRGVGLRVLTSEIDTTSSTGRLVFGIFAALAEFERDLVHERTMTGLAPARARGRHGCRPRVMKKAKMKVAMAMMVDRDNVAHDVAEQLCVPLSTLSTYLDGNGLPEPRAQLLLGDRKVQRAAPATPTAPLRHAVEGR